jgi:Peptidase family M1 domain
MRGLRGRFLIAALVAGQALLAGQSRSHADPLPAHAPRIADYDIAVRLDPETKRLDGRLRLTWRNPSTDSVPDLWFHLYLNAFRDRQSTFWRESRGQLRDVAMPKDGWGRIDVTVLRIANGADLLPSLTFEAPDDGNRQDGTLARVRLPQPVAPGGSVDLEIAFTAALPKAYARTGYAGDYFLVGQWFPKIAVYEPAGMRGRAGGGWNAHQFHAHSEFYADFGHYRVAITLPRRFIVGATGVRTARVDHGDGTTTHTYEQGDVHDFAWTASPRFVEITRRFDAARDVSAQDYRDAAARLGRSIEELRLGDVEVRLLMWPDHLPQADRYLRTTMRAIAAYGLAYGRYPHRTLTIVDPPDEAIGTGGMEYPTFFTAGTIAPFNAWPLNRIYLPEIVVAHEFAHQYFQGMVASNEFEEAWLDEGIGEWATGWLLDAMVGADRSFLELAGLRLSMLDYQRLDNDRSRGREMIRQPSWSYDTGYSFNAYERPSLTLRTLEGLLGHRTMARVMRTYAERWRYRHPSSDDFYRVASEVARRDLTPFFRQTIESPAVIDYAVGEIMQESAYTAVTVRREGDLQIPIVVAFKFAGRPVERRTWDGVARWTRFTFGYAEPLEWVDVDPERRVALDVSWLNNGRIVASDRRAPVAMTSRWLLAVQQVLSWLAF